MNVYLFPASANTYDSVAEVYEDLGDKRNAIYNYENELKLNPQNDEVANHLKKLKGKK